MVEILEVRRDGDNLVSSSGSTHWNFYKELEVDPFCAGVHQGSNEPMRIVSIMDFSETSVLLAMHTLSIFRKGIEDPEAWSRFEQGWVSTFSLSTSYAFDQAEDDQRRQAVERAFDVMDLIYTPSLVDISTRIQRVIKEKEFEELQRGMTIFGASITWAENYDTDEYTGYTNFDSAFSDMRWLIRGIDPYDEFEDDPQLDGAAAILADEQARRTTAAFRIGYDAMVSASQKEHMLSIR